MLGDGNDREGIAERMRDAEHAADETTHEIVRRVNTTFVTPFDREDIYTLASGLDDVMDFMEEAVDLVLLYEVEELPKELGRPGRGAPALRRADRRGDAAAADDEGPRGVLDRDQPAREPGDKSYRRILAKLFSGKYEALEVLKLKDIVDSLEDAIDAFETVANTVEQIAVKES